MGKIKYNFKVFFEKEAKILIRKYKSLITQKRGIRDDSAPANKPSTIKQKGFDHWLLDTGDLRANGFDSDAQSMELTVFAKKERHRGSRVSYEQLFEWHTKKYSGIFGLPIGSQFQQRLYREYFRQTQEHLTNWIKSENFKV